MEIDKRCKEQRGKHKMSMTREEAIKRIDEQYKICEEFYYLSASPEKDCPGVMSYMEALAVAISALHPVSRERVEKAWRGEWIPVEDNAFYNRCSKCGKIAIGKHSFCRNCGSPMTDEAVEMAMERLGELHETVE